MMSRTRRTRHRRLHAFDDAAIGVLILVLAGTTPASAQLSEAEEPAEAAEPEIVYFEQVSVDADGYVLDTLEMGSWAVTLSDGSTFFVDSDHLTDPDGNRYSIEGGISQAGAGEPLTYELVISRYSPHYMTQEEAFAEFVDQQPAATEAEIEAFVEQWNDPFVHEEPVTVVDALVEEWLDESEQDETITLVVKLREQPPLDLPRVSNALLVDEPALWLAAMEARLLAIEEREAEIYALQEDLIADAEALGAEVLWRSWSVNKVGLLAPPDIVTFLSNDERVARLSEQLESDLGLNDGGEAIRQATQSWMYWDEGYVGDTGYSHSRVYGAVTDNKIDIEHPAWLDGYYQYPRLQSTWRWVRTSGMWGSVTESSNQSNWWEHHGNYVTTQFLADLTDDQDPTVTGPNQLSKSGLSPESVFSFLEYKDDQGFSVHRAKNVEKLMELNTDVANYSIGCSDVQQGCPCNVAFDANDDTDTGYWDHIFMAQIAGNEGHLQQGSTCQLPIAGPCNVRAQATASGAFVVGATIKSGDLNSAPIFCASWDDGSCRGGDDKGRPIVKIVAPCGRQGWNNARLQCTLPGCVHAYYYGGCGTSTACPMVAGAAANLKDFLLTNYRNPPADDVGLLYATMLLMGDGTIEGSGTQTATTPIDELWGVGRMRMRLFTEAGMDEPWRWGFKIAELDHGEIIDQPLNYIYPGGNTTIPGEAEWMRAALWFYEPNIQDGQATSMIRYRAYSNLGQSYSCQSTAPQSQRLWLGNVLGNKKWTIRIQGLSVPESVNDVDPYYGETTRKVYSTYYWEDRSRDDQDGPGPEDDIY